MVTRFTSLAACTLAFFALSACESEPETPPAAQALTQDPLLARALADPLMADPDLSWRSEANAAIAFRDGHPLPLMTGDDAAARRARDAARVELLDAGRVPPLAPSQPGPGAPALGGLDNAEAILSALGARPDCAARLDSSLDWSLRLPDISAIMPHGMVHQAAGIDSGDCVVRAVRYRTPATIDDVLEDHHAKAERARFRVALHNEPERQLRAERRDQAIAVHVRRLQGDMSEVDVVHWRK
ncbi:hypothetical protein [Qipengyuania nanhaisediminis]|uniref:hypothetical protein n=1 Tax=Qipengyuania nanhaisediminis TaxID=604088 RepID=UPI0038B3370F